MAQVPVARLQRWARALGIAVSPAVARTPRGFIVIRTEAVTEIPLCRFPPRRFLMIMIIPEAVTEIPLPFSSFHVRAG
jgi:hypothetical protein